MMRLLSSDFSPYSTRVRIQIRKKNLPIEICLPEPPLRTPEFLTKYPLGKIPVLELDDNRTIAESWAIMQYLEDAFPEVPLKSAKPFEAAQECMLARFADLHLGPALFPMFGSLLTGSKININHELKNIYRELDKGERLLETMSDFKQRDINLGDVALAPTMYFSTETPKMFDCIDLLANYPLLKSWWLWVQTDADVAQGVKEMNTAFHSFMAAYKKA